MKNYVQMIAAGCGAVAGAVVGVLSADSLTPGRVVELSVFLAASGAVFGLVIAKNIELARSKDA